MVLGQGWPKKLPRRKHPAEPNTGSAANGPRTRFYLLGPSFLGLTGKKEIDFIEIEEGL